MTFKKIGFFLCSFFCFLVLLFLGIQIWIATTTADKIYSDVTQIPNANAAIVLGTSRYLKNGKSNPFYEERIKGAATLYSLQKINHLIVSGDNRHISYNEPRMMAQDLIKQGVPAAAITYDFAGFRTLDSIVRANKVFALDHFIIVTQDFHCERTLFIAQKYDINAICFGVQSPENSFSVRFRELFARIKAVIDLYLLHQQPRFLGPAAPIFEKTDSSSS